jgi:hypothetical protein
VELKNDCNIAGIVEDCDKDMNTNLSKVRITDQDGNIKEVESMRVNGSSIRYIHFPQKLKAAVQLTDYIKKLDKLRNRSRPHFIKDRVKRGSNIDLLDEKVSKSRKFNNNEDIHLIPEFTSKRNNYDDIIEDDASSKLFNEE